MADVRIVADAPEVARVAAGEFLDRLDQAGREGRPFRVALAGGRTPRGMYEELAAAGAPGGKPVDWPRVHVFFGDERVVPPEHPESNFRLAREALLSRVPLPEANVHRVRAELPDPDEAAERYESEVRAVFGSAPGEWPRFDLVLLGLGTDGHVASLFPGSPALSERRRVVLAPWVESLGTRRITLTLPAINHAAGILFLASGGEKAEILRSVLDGGSGETPYPAQLVDPQRGTVLWIADHAAARLLHRRA